MGNKEVIDAIFETFESRVCVFFFVVRPAIDRNCMVIYRGFMAVTGEGDPTRIRSGITNQSVVIHYMAALSLDPWFLDGIKYHIYLFLLCFEVRGALVVFTSFSFSFHVHNPYPGSFSE